MDNPIEFSKLVPVDEYVQTNADERDDIEEFHQSARAFLESFAWSGSVAEAFVGMVFPGIVGVFLFRQEGARADVDEWLWVVVGDLPPAYLVLDCSPNAATALKSYIFEMRKWVEAVRTGQSLEAVIPVNVPPSQEYAESLASRLEFLEEHVLSLYECDLEQQELED